MAQKKAKRPAHLKSFSLTQMLDPAYFNFKDPRAQQYMTQCIENKDLHEMMRLIEILLNQNAWEISEMYGIIHDKDTRLVWNEDVMDKVHETKPAHVHISVRFKDNHNKNATIEAIANALGVESQYIEKPKSGRYSWDNQLAYLIHAKDEDKHQYDPKEVCTLLGDDYMNIYHENIDTWKNGAIKKKNLETAESVELLEYLILTGRITRGEMLLTDNYYEIYAQNKRRLDDAFDTYAQRKMYKALQRLENGEFKTTVYYIMGKPGAGKTRFATEYAQYCVDKAKEELGEDWTIGKTASTNPVDDYMGEEVLIMDDVRGSTMRADDWLKLLDPYNVSPSSARYHNKVVTARVIIITAVIPPYKFFYYTKGVGQGTAQAEAIDQFLRRLMSIVEVVDYDKVIVKKALPSNKPIEYQVGLDYDKWHRSYSSICTKSNYAIEEDDDFKGQSREEIKDSLWSDYKEHNYCSEENSQIIEAEVVPEGNEDN